LLCYYADMLFKNSNESFLKIVDFLINSLSLTGE
jgi:hypothetical protein